MRALRPLVPLGLMERALRPLVSLGPIAAGVVVVCEPTPLGRSPLDLMERALRPSVPLEPDWCRFAGPDAAGVNLTPPGPGFLTATFLCITVGKDDGAEPVPSSGTGLEPPLGSGSARDASAASGGLGLDRWLLGRDCRPLEPFAAAGPIAIDRRWARTGR